MRTLRRARIARYAAVIYVISGIILGCKAFAEASVETRVSEPSAHTTFNLPAQPLKNALLEFGRLSRTHLLYDAHLAQGAQSAALTGNYTRDA